MLHYWKNTYNPSFKTNKLCAFPAQKRRHVDALSYCRCVTTDSMYGGVRDDVLMMLWGVREEICYRDTPASKNCEQNNNTNLKVEIPWKHQEQNSNFSWLSNVNNSFKVDRHDDIPSTSY